MSAIDVNNLLAQMRQMRSTVGMPDLRPAARPVEGSVLPQSTRGADFASLLKDSISAVGNQQMEAGRMAQSFERGDPGADLARTMIAVQKADLSLRTMVEVRNKLVDAYKDIMNMPV